MSSDLEKEFEQLINELFDKIDHEKNDGSLSAYEFDGLINLMRRKIDSSCYSLDCPDGHIGDCGWSSSMGYHC